MSHSRNLSVDPQAELRRRFVTTMKAEQRAREAALAAGLTPRHAGWPRVDLAPFTELRCGARGKRTGKTCPHTALYVNGRCYWHGGPSTGPRTPEGKARSGRAGAGVSAAPAAARDAAQARVPDSRPTPAVSPAPPLDPAWLEAVQRAVGAAW